MDFLKQSDDLSISDTAFALDERTSFNYGQIPSMKKKAYQRLEMIKLQREKRLGVREQFEVEHEDASINYNGERSRSEDEMYIASSGFTFQAGGRKMINKWTNYQSNKKVVSTFGTVKRFAPEPGSVHSHTQ